MTTAVQRRRGTNTEHATFTGLDGEITVNTTTYTLHVHDGATVGGIVLAKADGSNIVTSSIDINGGTIDGTVIGGSSAAAGTFTSITGTSANINGTVTADGLTVSNSSLQVKLEEADGTYNPRLITYFDSSGTHLQHTWSSGADSLFVELGGAEGAGVKAMRIQNNDISFYEDTGTTAKFFWDASAERLGIGTTSPASALDVTGTVTADGLTVDTAIDTTGITINTPYGTAGEQYAALRWNNSSFAGGDSEIRNVVDGSTSLGSSLEFHTEQTGTGTLTERLKLHNNGDISFYEDTGTTAKFFWDASAESLKIGDNTNSYSLNTGGIASIGTGYNGAYSPVLFLDNRTATTGRNYGINSSDAGLFQLFDVDAGYATRLVVDSSGNVGIGTTSPQALLHVSGGAADTNAIFGSSRPLYVKSLTSPASYVTLGYGDSEHIGISSSVIVFSGNGSLASGGESARIDGSGNLLVGKTAIGSTTDGFEARASGYTALSDTSGAALNVNRNTTDGNIVTFTKDGTTVGSIGTLGGALSIGNNTNSGILFNGTALQPTSGGTSRTDGVNNIGASAYRFNDVYATNALIQTSDANEKQDIEVLSEAEQRVAVAAKGLLRKFRWKDSVAEKGDDARIHFGIIAQDLQAAFEAEGLDAGDYAMFIHSTWTDEETGEERSRMGVRYSELLAFIIAAI